MEDGKEEPISSTGISASGEGSGGLTAGDDVSFPMSFAVKALQIRPTMSDPPSMRTRVYGSNAA